jgi:hypothetical protein
LVVDCIKGLVLSGSRVALTSRVDDMETKDNVEVGDELLTHLKHTIKVGNGVQRGLASSTWNYDSINACKWWSKPWGWKC